MNTGDKFYINIRPSNFSHLYGKELTVGVSWKGGDVIPIEEFCNIEKKYISLIPPPKLKFGLLERIKFILNLYKA